MITNRWARIAMFLTWVLPITFGLVACGVKSSPQHPVGSSYPRQYPETFVPLESKTRPEKSKSEDQGGNIYQYPNTVPIR